MQVFDSSMHTICQSGGARLNQLTPGSYFYEGSCELGGWDPQWSGVFTISPNQCTPIEII